MKDKRYKGSMLARGGKVITVELWQETDRPYRKTGQLDFPANEPLRIEWAATEKSDVIEVSHATLRVFSPGDRTYADLWKAGDRGVRMDVYIDDTLYWSGTMDCEQYEEPYWTDKGYEVTMVFGDFGVLDRIKYLGVGVKSVADIIRECAIGSGIRFDFIEDLTSTLASSNHKALYDIGVSCEAWIDDDGEMRTMREVLESTLQPLGMKIRQRGGRLWLYDFQGLCELPYADLPEVEWTAADQTLGADRTYSHLRVQWSPRCRDGNLLEDSPWGDELPDALPPVINGSGAQPYYYYFDESFVVGGSYNQDCYNFVLWVKSEGRGLMVNEETGARIMYLQSGNEKHEEQGVAVVWHAPFIASWAELGATSAVHGVNILNLANGEGTVLRTEPFRVENTCSHMRLKVEVPLAIGRRVNPFNDYGLNDEAKDEVEDIRSEGPILMVPARIDFTSDDGERYVWSNLDIVDNEEEMPQTGLAGTLGRWLNVRTDNIPGAMNSQGMLMWYEPGMYKSDDAQGSGMTDTGFVTNRPAVGINPGRLTSVVENTTGQCLPMPPGSGTMRLTIGYGWHTRKKGERASIIDNQVERCRHVLIGAPKVKLTRDNVYDGELDSSNREYVMEIDPKAHEELKIETTCGTSEYGVAGARGAYIDMSTGQQVTQLTRGMNTATAEELLGATMLAQYWHRMVKLSGEARVMPDIGVTAWTEANQPRRRFMLVSESQNLIRMEADVTLTEVAQDDEL